jgi:hypothetical protein
MCLLRFFTGSVDLDLACINFHAHATYIGDFSINLVEECWYRGKGKEVVEMYLARRLFGSLICSYAQGCSEVSRWPSDRRKQIDEVHTPVEGSTWPEDYGPTDIERLGKYTKPVSLSSLKKVEYIGKNVDLSTLDYSDKEKVYIRTAWIMEQQPDGTWFKRDLD